MATTYNYQNGKIYTIRSHQTDKYYIGSTMVKTLAQRLGGHTAKYKRYLRGNRDDSITSFEILKYDDYYIELLENYPCSNKEQLRKREGELIRQYKSEIVNLNIAGRTQKEWTTENDEKVKHYKKEHYTNYRQSIIEKAKTHQINNKETRAEYLKQYNFNNNTILREKKKQYYEIHKQESSEKAKQTFNCECGKTITICYKALHNKTKKHLLYLQTTITEPTEPILNEPTQSI